MICCFPAVGTEANHSACQPGHVHKGGREWENHDHAPTFQSWKQSSPSSYDGCAGWDCSLQRVRGRM